jgi:transposase
MLTQEVVNMGQTRRAFTREFKQEAVKLVTAGGHPTAQVARDLGVTPNLLRRWKHEVAGDPVAAFPGKGRRKPHEEERVRLKRDVARVTQGRDFLKSVAAYFAKPSS